MSDLLALLGDEWALPVVQDEPAEDYGGFTSCKHPERSFRTHGCRESGRTPVHWSDVGAGGYVDGMGRPDTCNYCSACIGSGRVMIRDPWTDMPVARASASCVYCAGTGWISHKWDCDGSWHERTGLAIHEPIPAGAFGIAYPHRTVIPGEIDLPTHADTPRG